MVYYYGEKDGRHHFEWVGTVDNVFRTVTIHHSDVVTRQQRVSVKRMLKREGTPSTLIASFTQWLKIHG